MLSSFRLLRILSARSHGFWRFLLLAIVFAFVELVTLGTLSPIISFLADQSRNPIDGFLPCQIALDAFCLDLAVMDKTSQIYLISMVAVVLITISLILKLVITYLGSKYAQDLKTNLTLLVYEKFSNFGYDKISRLHSSEVEKQIIFEVDQLYSNLVAPLIPMLMQVFASTFLISAAIVYDPFKSLFIIVTIGIAYLLVGTLGTRGVAALGGKIFQLNQERHELVAENFRNLRYNLITFNFDRNFRKYEENVKDLAVFNTDALYRTSRPRIIMESTIFYLVVSLVAFSVFWESIDEQFIASLGIVFLGTIRAVPGLQATYNFYASTQQAKAAISSFLGLLEEKLETSDDLFVVARQLLPAQPDISQSNDHRILTNELVVPTGVSDKYIGSHTLDRRSRVLVVGPSGSGKSTFVDVLLGLRQPKNGHVTYIRSGEKVHYSRFWEAVSYVPQDLRLPKMGLGDYLRGKLHDHVDVAHYEKCLDICRVREIISPYTIDEFAIEENGGNLSGGQRQRLAICAALVKKPSFLVLDEATSGIPEEEAKDLISDVIETFEVGLVLVTHQDLIKSLFEIKIDLSD